MGLPAASLEAAHRALQTRQQAASQKLSNAATDGTQQAFLEAAYRFIEERTGSGCALRVGRRRIVTIAGARVVGFALDLSRLSEAASLTLQEQGLGGRRHMGCGLFLPTPTSRARDAFGDRATG